jgi:TRAP-type C4-dicarboxylate transport system substrate-binding protein
VLVIFAAAGCGSSASQSTADKSGGSGAPVVLRLADPYDSTITDAAALQWIVKRVDSISHGKLRIRIVYNAAGDKIAGVEAQVARMVEKGQFDLGWIGTRAWDELGVKSFQALQAPFLVTDYALLDRILTGPLAGQMLAGLQRRNVVGLVLVPDLMRHPIGVRRPFVSLADFKGARIRDIPSRLTDALLRALGAVPVHVAGADFNDALVHHRFDGQELPIVNTIGFVVTGNVMFFPKVMTLFMGRQAFDRLSDGQKSVLREAAVQLRRHIFAPSENAFISHVCSPKVHSRIVLASEQQLERLEQAARPVYVQLESNGQTRSLIAAIRRLKASLPPPAAIVAPRSCATVAQPPPATGPERATSLLNGTYRWVATAAAARAFGPPATNPENQHYPLLTQAGLRDGKWIWTTGGSADRGTYTVSGSTITFITPGYGSGPLRFKFRRDSDGTLHLKAVQPMDPGDEWVWSSGPWHRIGPPIATP